ncbi:MAG: HD domain-containing protein [Calothrix sp. SM1_5_4]|nr:HD domain-containing protein [Calothrix sp. SM1_5_4]
MGYSSIRVSVLRGDQKIGFDVFVQVGTKHILYLRQGDSFEGTRLARLKEKKVKKMYIREEDEQLYRDYMARNIDMAYDQKGGQSMENRAQIIQGVQQAAAEAVFESPEDAEVYQAAKEGTRRFTEFLLAEDKAIKSLLAIENTDQSLGHHGVTVASLAVEIAKITGYKETKNLSIMALGGLLHDLGHYISGQIISSAA